MKNNLLLILIIIILIGGGVVYYQSNKIQILKNSNNASITLIGAMNDTITTFKGDNGVLISQKLTLQGDIKKLDKLFNQKNELITMLKNDNTIITAALIKSEILIDSMANNKSIIDSINNSITFSDDDNNDGDDIAYNISIKNVIPFKGDPIMIINSLRFENEQIIKFNWSDNKELGNPISFSISNSNQYFKVNDIESYAIPALNKKTINPSGWQKLGTYFKRDNNTPFYIGVGMLLGGGSVYLLSK